jgi:type IV pilus assembly protein PilA
MKHIQKGFTLIELMIVVAIIGILAAVAIPAYQDYIAKAQATEAFSLLDGLKTPIAEAFSQDPTTGCAAPLGAVITGKYVLTITFTPVALTGCTILATFKGAGVSGKVANTTVTVTYDSITGQWPCTTTLPAEIKPKSCT